ncbi:MAG: GerMN domain-containing protein [Acidimicrobiia bacterium]|nr:GerMN domain-containing protein [Acidimicrobiia bacterium]
MNKVVVPVVFGSNLVAGYTGYSHRVVVDGDTLSGIAVDEYGVASDWPAIFEANRDQIGDPNRVYHGQRLRIPHYPRASTTEVEVYFLDTVRFADGTEPYVEAVSRRVPAATPAAGALDALFAGPTPAEQGANLAVELSEATGFSGLSIESGIARVTLVGGCDSGGSTFTIANLITPTLKQFATVDYVKIYDADGTTAAPEGSSDSIPECLNP